MITTITRRLRETPYCVTVGCSRHLVDMLCALNHPDDYALTSAPTDTDSHHVLAAFYYSNLDPCVGCFRHAAQDNRHTTYLVAGDLRVQLALPPAHPDKPEIARLVKRMTGWAMPGPFLVSAASETEEQHNYRAAEVVGREPNVVIANRVFFHFDRFCDAVGACTRLALADGTYDGEGAQ